VPVSEISQSHFNSLGLPDDCRALWSRLQETSWFTDSTGTVLGVVLFNPETGYWAYVMCGRVDGGDFKRLGIGADFTSIELARRDLAASMERHVARNEEDQ
jgi:hypothetical protein